MLKATCLKILDYVFPHKCLNCSSMTESGGGLCGKCFAAINFIEGAYCDTCGNIFDISIHKGLICARCIRKNPSYDKARTLFKFNALSKKVIHDFKYNDKTNYAKFFAKLFLLKYRDLLSEVDIITSVPMHRLKRLYRFYNPPMLIAKEMAKILTSEYSNKNGQGNRLLRKLAIDEEEMLEAYGAQGRSVLNASEDSSCRGSDASYLQKKSLAKKPNNKKGIELAHDLLLKTKLTKTQTALKQPMRYKNVKNSIKVNANYNIKGKKILLIDDVLTTGATAGYCSKVLKAAGAKNVYFFSVART